MHPDREVDQVVDAQAAGDFLVAVRLAAALEPAALLEQLRQALAPDELREVVTEPARHAGRASAARPGVGEIQVHARHVGLEALIGYTFKDKGRIDRGYHADCTRTVVVGRAPEDWQAEIYDVVRRAQAAGREALHPGADVREVDAVARAVVVSAGHGARFTHGLGHGVGLEVHEAPLLGPTGTGRLLDRTPVTVEPGVYLPGRGGVRIEDTLVVGDGAPDLLVDAVLGHEARGRGGDARPRSGLPAFAAFAGHRRDCLSPGI